MEKNNLASHDNSVAKSSIDSRHEINCSTNPDNLDKNQFNSASEAKKSNKNDTGENSTAQEIEGKKEEAESSFKLLMIERHNASDDPRKGNEEYVKNKISFDTLKRIDFKEYEKLFRVRQTNTECEYETPRKRQKAIEYKISESFEYHRSYENRKNGSCSFEKVDVSSQHTKKGQVDRTSSSTTYQKPKSKIAKELQNGQKFKRVVCDVMKGVNKGGKLKETDKNKNLNRSLFSQRSGGVKVDNTNKLSSNYADKPPSSPKKESSRVDPSNSIVDEKSPYKSRKQKIFGDDLLEWTNKKFSPNFSKLKLKTSPERNRETMKRRKSLNSEDPEVKPKKIDKRRNTEAVFSLKNLDVPTPAHKGEKRETDTGTNCKGTSELEESETIKKIEEEIEMTKNISGQSFLEVIPEPEMSSQEVFDVLKPSQEAFCDDGEIMPEVPDVLSMMKEADEKIQQTEEAVDNNENQRSENHTINEEIEMIRNGSDQTMPKVAAVLEITSQDTVISNASQESVSDSGGTILQKKAQMSITTECNTKRQQAEGEAYQNDDGNNKIVPVREKKVVSATINKSQPAKDKQTISSHIEKISATSEAVLSQEIESKTERISTDSAISLSRVTYFGHPEVMPDENLERVGLLKSTVPRLCKANYGLVEDMSEIATSLKEDRSEVIEPFIDLTKAENELETFSKVQRINIQTDSSMVVKQELCDEEEIVIRMESSAAPLLQEIKKELPEKHACVIKLEKEFQEDFAGQACAISIEKFKVEPSSVGSYMCEAVETVAKSFRPEMVSIENLTPKDSRTAASKEDKYNSFMVEQRKDTKVDQTNITYAQSAGITKEVTSASASLQKLSYAQQIADSIVSHTLNCYQHNSAHASMLQVRPGTPSFDAIARQNHSVKKQSSVHGAPRSKNDSEPLCTSQIGSTNSKSQDPNIPPIPMECQNLSLTKNNSNSEAPLPKNVPGISEVGNINSTPRHLKIPSHPRVRTDLFPAKTNSVMKVSLSKNDSCSADIRISEAESSNISIRNADNSSALIVHQNLLLAKQNSTNIGNSTVCSKISEVRTVSGIQNDSYCDYTSRDSNIPSASMMFQNSTLTKQPIVQEFFQMQTQTNTNHNNRHTYQANSSNAYTKKNVSQKPPIVADPGSPENTAKISKHFKTTEQNCNTFCQSVELILRNSFTMFKAYCEVLPSLFRTLSTIYTNIQLEKKGFDEIVRGRVYILSRELFDAAYKLSLEDLYYLNWNNFMSYLKNSLGAIGIKVSDYQIMEILQSFILPFAKDYDQSNVLKMFKSNVQRRFEETKARVASTDAQRKTQNLPVMTDAQMNILRSQIQVYLSMKTSEVAKIQETLQVPSNPVNILDKRSCTASSIHNGQRQEPASYPNQKFTASHEAQRMEINKNNVPRVQQVVSQPVLKHSLDKKKINSQNYRPDVHHSALKTLARNVSGNNRDKINKKLPSLLSSMEISQLQQFTMYWNRKIEQQTTSQPLQEFKRQPKDINLLQNRINRIIPESQTPVRGNDLKTTKNICNNGASMNKKSKPPAYPMSVRSQSEQPVIQRITKQTEQKLSQGQATSSINRSEENHFSSAGTESEGTKLPVSQLNPSKYVTVITPTHAMAQGTTEPRLEQIKIGKECLQKTQANILSPPQPGNISISSIIRVPEEALPTRSIPSSGSSSCLVPETQIVTAAGMETTSKEDVEVNDTQNISPNSCAVALDTNTNDQKPIIFPDFGDRFIDLTSPESDIKEEVDIICVDDDFSKEELELLQEDYPKIKDSYMFSPGDSGIESPPVQVVENDFEIGYKSVRVEEEDYPHFFSYID